MQYRQRRRADRELAKVHREWREHSESLQATHDQYMTMMYDRLAAQIQQSADLAEKHTAENWRLNFDLQQRKNGTEKPD